MQAVMMLFAPLLTAVLAWVFKSYGYRVTGHAKRDREERERQDAVALQQVMIARLKRKRSSRGQTQEEIAKIDGQIAYLEDLVYQRDVQHLTRMLGVSIDGIPKVE